MPDPEACIFSAARLCALVASASLFACGWWVEVDSAEDDGTATSSSGDETTSAATGVPELCPGAPGAGLPTGKPCTEKEECQSGCCETFSEAPRAIGLCVDAPTRCETRSVGRVLSFPSRTPVVGLDTWLIPASDAATGPETATPLGQGFSTEDGHFDVTTDLVADVPFGVMMLVKGDGYFPTTAGVAPPNPNGSYDACPRVRDMWALPNGALDAYESALTDDPEVAPHLPLAQGGAVLGIIRWLDTGEPASGARVVPAAGDSSDMVVRYLDDSGVMFVGDETRGPGVFLLAGTLPGEEFDVVLEGGTPDPVTVDRLRAGPTKRAVFTVGINLVED